MVILYPELRNHEILDGRVSILGPMSRDGCWVSDRWWFLDIKEASTAEEKETGHCQQPLFKKSHRVSAIMALLLPMLQGDRCRELRALPALVVAQEMSQKSMLLDKLG